MAAVVSSSAAATSRGTSSPAARSGRARATTRGSESPVVNTGGAGRREPNLVRAPQRLGAEAAQRRQVVVEQVLVAPYANPAPVTRESLTALLEAAY